MNQAELEALPSARLFELCASCFEDDRYWEEFVRRFNHNLTRSVYHAYRRFSSESQLHYWVLSELLQESYLKILKDRCASLRRFRGQTELEAEVYLMHIATSVTIDEIRRQQSLKRQISFVPLEKSQLLEKLWDWQEKTPSLYTDELAEYELIRLLRRTFTGENSQRDILIFLLYFREGLTPQEIARAGICDLKPASIAHKVERMRDKIRSVAFSNE
jgi:DNA-directed RNA polymerase specialized sigma24 family protein